MEESKREKITKLESAEADLTEEVQIWSEISPSKFEAPVEKQVHHRGDTSCTSSISSSPCIFRTPFPGLEFQEPRLVSIGPYHRSKNLPLDKYKYFFLEKFISRTKNQGKDLRFYVKQMMTLEWPTRRCYSEDLSMSSPEFAEMMLVDGCFIMEVLGYFGKSSESADLFSLVEPWQLPILVQDLLMLENQIPFFVLEKLYDSLESEEGKARVSLPTMALNFFDLAFPRSMDFDCKFNHLEANHLLDLFLESIRPSNPSTNLNSLHLFLKTIHMKTMVTPKLVYSFLKKIIARNQASVPKKDDDILLETVATNPKLKEALSAMRSEPSISKRVQHGQECDPPPPVHLTKNAMELQTSGIELRPKRAARFTDINFKNGMFEIPPITIDDLFVAVLINGIAFEHSSKRISKDLSAYVSFMSRLIRRPSDAELLYANGIISGFSHNDKKVVDSFHLLHINIVDLDIQESYISNRLKEIECYHTGDGKAWCWWDYVLRYWRISFFCITNFLFAFNYLRSSVNLMIHLVQEVIVHAVYADFPGDIICSWGHSSFICNSVFLIVRFIYDSARGRVKSIDLSLSKFMFFCLVNQIIVLIILMACEFPAPTLTFNERDIEVEDSHTVDHEQDRGVEDSLTVDHKQDREVEVSISRREKSVGDTTRVAWFFETVTVDKSGSIVDCMGKDMDRNEEYYNEPWRTISEHKVIRMFLSALRVT